MRAIRGLGLVALVLTSIITFPALVLAAGTPATASRGQTITRAAAIFTPANIEACYKKMLMGDSDVDGQIVFSTLGSLTCWENTSSVQAADGKTYLSEMLQVSDHDWRVSTSPAPIDYINITVSEFGTYTSGGLQSVIQGVLTSGYLLGMDQTYQGAWGWNYDGDRAVQTGPGEFEICSPKVITCANGRNTIADLDAADQTYVQTLYDAGKQLLDMHAKQSGLLDQLKATPHPHPTR